MLAGRPDHGRELATSLCRLSDAAGPDQENALRAAIILGDHHQATTLAQTLAPGLRAEQQADLIRHVELIARGDPSFAPVIDCLRPHPVIHYTGHIIAGPQWETTRFPAAEEHQVADRIAALLDTMPVSAAYGSLAAGADILFAEALPAREVPLHVVLPFRKEDFIRLSVRLSGTAWLGRFENCLRQAASVRYATDDFHLGHDHLFEYGSQLAMGLAVLMAEHLRTRPLQLALWDGTIREGVAGTVKNLWIWERAGHQRHVIPCGPARTGAPLVGYVPPPPPDDLRITRALLFGDIKGFSKLSDRDIPNFAKIILAGIAAAVDRHGGSLAFKNSWGDGIFLVFDDAGQAAECALAIQQTLGALNLASSGLPSHMGLRMGGHLGPTYKIEDPLLGRPNFYGAHVSRAARIEPVTPVGSIYVTEPFAAVLALHNARTLACDYVGKTETAKDYGALGLFLLRRR